MAKSNIVLRTFRLNLDNEQHRRVNKVLAELNTDIHKSVNQFLADAVDFYIRSANDENLIKESGQREQADTEYVLRSDLAAVSNEIKNEVKNEIIMLLGAALANGNTRAAETGTGRTAAAEPVAKGRETEEIGETDDPTMTELVDNWG